MKVFIAATVMLILVAGVYSSPLETGTTSEEGLPSEYYRQEVQEQLEQRGAELEEKPHERVARSTSDGTCNITTPTNRPVKHGSTLALQLVYKKFNWLGCSTSNTRCANSLCPGLYMEGEEWRSCRQNVFQIFRARGHGDVKVGDMVGLHLTRESGKWLNCGPTLCAKGSCPGIASYEYGFDAPEKWYRCYGSVFKLYARGKQLGETIQDRDHIMLLYLQALNWIGASDANHHRGCPGSTRPPPPSRYDCGGENYEIWKK